MEIHLNYRLILTKQVNLDFLGKKEGREEGREEGRREGRKEGGRKKGRKEI